MRRLIVRQIKSKNSKNLKQSKMQKEEILKDLMYKIADDQLIIGHRNSEWTGVGPLLEEDIAFSSMAQDKVGQSWAIYKLLEDLGETEPDINAFTRNAEQFHNSQLVELPNQDYDFSLMRHVLFDYAESIRFEMLALSSYEPLAQLAQKIKGEIKYHVMHGRSFVRKLGTSTEEAIIRLQKALDYSLPYALGVFEPSKYEDEMKQAFIFEGEKILEERWKEQIETILKGTELKLPNWNDIEPIYGGRYGIHTDHLQPLLDEMTEVFNVDPTAEW